jgi:glyoxylase-like metal-dependent hydrolase (beta-lactamase superfamily II)
MKRIQLENSLFEGLNNAYLLGTEMSGPTVLVDTGLGLQNTREMFVEKLAEYGLAFDDIDEVLVTHFHADHAGLVGPIQQSSEAVVRAHPADAPLIERDKTQVAEFKRRWAESIDQWGISQTNDTDLLDYLDYHNMYAEPGPAVTPIHDGARLRFGRDHLTAIHLPGHTAGLCGFVVDREDGPELISGDVLLPHYTPNVGGTDLRLDQPLETYIRTLKLIIEQSFTRVWPGHRDVIESPSERAQEIIEHHRDRARRVYAIVDEHGPVNVWETSIRLFGDLEGIHLLSGVGEAHAHLIHLMNHGIATKGDDGYTVTEPIHIVDETFS